jgi:Sec-independent protein translocase protein TatA
VAKLLVVCLVFIVVFNPKKLPDLIKHLSFIYIKTMEFKNQLSDYWLKKIQNELQLQENIAKAAEVDAKYMDNEAQIDKKIIC